MKRAAALFLLATTIACSGSRDPANPASPSATGPNGADSAAAGHAVLRVPADYTTVQAAVAAAASGDTIEVSPGTYCERVMIVGKADLRIHSPAGQRAILDGSCLDRLDAGIHLMNSTNVEIMGFIIQHFEYGLQVMSSTQSRFLLNEVRFNTTVPRTGVAAKSRGVAILLKGSSANTVIQNSLHDNGRNGVVVDGGSGNTIQSNRLADNNLENGGCNLMLTGGTSSNSVVENEITGTYGVGVMIGPGGVVSGNHVAQNRIHGFAGPGIIAMATATGNVIEQNNARDNGLTFVSPQDVDLFDVSQPVDNTWRRNLGTCGPGVC